jgi:NAD-dependent deacetylase
MAILSVDSALIEEIKERLLAAGSTVVLTGAGVSAESGVPTFRGSGGLWKKYRAEELATPGAFARDPKLVWQWYQWRREKLKSLKPNPAHEAIAAMEEASSGFTLVTQNVDGLHKAAGSREIVELHGNIWRTRCTGCFEIKETLDLPVDALPYCGEEGCEALLRPDIVWFGESLDPEVLTKALNAIDSAELIFVVGTSALVQPAASFAIRGKERGAYVVEVNPGDTPISDYVDTRFREKAGVVMPLFI